MSISPMSPRRPHLLRAFYYWLLENHLTPHVVADISCPGVMVPMDLARDGRVVLNIAPSAAANLSLGQHDVCFDASFGGISRHITLPMASILAIYARENGAGTVFEPADYDLHCDDRPEVTEQPDADGLALVAKSPRMDEGVDNRENPDNNDDDPLPPHRAPPVLRVVK